MSRNESSLLFSLKELRTLEDERVAQEHAAAAAVEARRQQALVEERSAAAEHARVQDALRAAVVERDAQTALARRAVERHTTLAHELAETKLALEAAESRAEAARAAAPAPPPTPPRSRAWTIANGLIAIGSLSLLTATIVFRVTPIEARTIEIPMPVAVAAPPRDTPKPASVAVDPIAAPTPTKPKPQPRPSRATTSKPDKAVTCLDDPLCGID